MSGEGPLMVPRPVLAVLGGSQHIERGTGTAYVNERDIRPTEGDQDLNMGNRVARVWPDVESAALLARALREAASSRLFSGTTPETWSPLGSAQRGDAGLMSVRQDNVFYESEYEGLPGAATLAYTNTDRGSVLLTLQDEEALGAAIFSDDAFLVALPPETTHLRVEYDPDAGPQSQEAKSAKRALLKWLPDGELTTVLIWRAYAGSNTVVVDGMTELGPGRVARIGLAAANTAAVFVARVAFAIHPRQNRRPNDPTAQRRLRIAETSDQKTARMCPPLKTLGDTGGVLVVAVHGTMACAMPMAAALRGIVFPGAVRRFEHDTWLPIGDNVRDLVAQVNATGERKVVMIAHSRGGLVARHAAELLGRTGVEISVLTLGTPFQGTPIVAGVRGGLLGVRALMGAVRVMPGGVVLDPVTRLAGLLLKRDVPPGIEAMGERSAYLEDYQGLAPSTQHIKGMFGGRADLNDQPDRYGLAVNQGFASVAFEGAENDLVVGSASATMDGATNSRVIASDHFSYLEHYEVRTAITQEFAKVTNSPLH